MVPSSVAKRNKARAVLFSRNPVVLLNTWPVGADGGAPPAGGGIVTTMGLAAGAASPLPSYTLMTPVPLFETQNGPVGLAELPHGFTRFGSRCAAWAGRSETKPCSR